MTLAPSGETPNDSAGAPASKPASLRREAAVSFPGTTSWTKTPATPSSSRPTKAIRPSLRKRGRPTSAPVTASTTSRGIEKTSAPSAMRTMRMARGPGP